MEDYCVICGKEISDSGRMVCEECEKRILNEEKENKNEVHGK